MLTAPAPSLLLSLVFASRDTVTAPAQEEISPVSVPRRSAASLLSLGCRRAGREPCRDLSRCPGSASPSCSSSCAPAERQPHRSSARRGAKGTFVLPRAIPWKFCAEISWRACLWSHLLCPLPVSALELLGDALVLCRHRSSLACPGRTVVILGAASGHRGCEQSKGTGSGAGGKGCLGRGGNVETPMVTVRSWAGGWNTKPLGWLW